MRRLIIILFAILSNNIFAQDLNFRQVDSTTYNQYLRGEWKELIESGNEAIEQGVDYYYLRMRIAWAYFALEQYRSAEKHYKKALAFNASDANANLYLYYSYLYSGQKNNAYIQSKNLTEEEKVLHGINDSSFIRSIGLFYSHSPDMKNINQDELLSGISQITNGVQKATHSLILPGIFLKHSMGEHVTASHSYKYLLKNEFSYLIDQGTEYISSSQTIKQSEYILNLNICPVKGLMVSPGIHFIHYAIPIYETGSYGPGSGNNREVVNYISKNTRAYIISAGTQQRYFDAGISYVNHNFANAAQTHQFGIHLTAYPFSNLNLYYTLDNYFQLINYGINDVERNYTFKQVLGFRAHKNLWIELTARFPEIMFLYDVQNGIAYNSLEKLHNSFGASAIIPLYKSNIKLLFSYSFNNNSSRFFPDDRSIEPFNNYTFTNHIISGGITWDL